MKQVLVVMSTDWDARQLAACRARWEERFELAFAQPRDADCSWKLDVESYLDELEREWGGRIAGVLSSSDYPGASLAAALANRLGLPGPPVAAVIRSSHKFYSRVTQAEVVPEATPAFDLVVPERAGLDPLKTGYPCFVKPVKGAFSVLARRIESAEAMRAFFQRPSVREFRAEWMRIFNQLVRRYTELEHDGDHFIAEGLLRGAQVTLEGYCVDGEVTVLGVVDSHMYPGTTSFQRFEYPSRLDAAVQQRMADVTRRLVPRLGLERTMFNIELVHDPDTDAVHIIEVNPRICGQFADLYEKVDGVNGYELALQLATGEAPVVHHGSGRFGAAASYPFRVFAPMRVTAAPDPLMLAQVEAEFPGTLVWPECSAGQEITDFDRIEDGASYRYAVVNTGAGDPVELEARIEAIRARLGYAFEPLGEA